MAPRWLTFTAFLIPVGSVPAIAQQIMCTCAFEDTSRGQGGGNARRLRRSCNEFCRHAFLRDRFWRNRC